MRYLSPSHRLAALGFLVAIAYWPGLFSAPSMPRWWVIAIGVPLLCDLRVFFGNSTLAGLTAMAMTWAATAVALSDYPFGGILPLIMLGLLVAVAWAANSVDNVEPPVAAFGWGLALSSAIAVAQFFGWDAVPMGGYPGGLFFSSEVLGETAAPILVWAIVSRRWALAGMMLSTVLITHTRTGAAAAIIGMIYVWRPSSRWMKPLACAALLMACLVALTTMGEIKMNSAFTRGILWGAALQSITLLGRGLGWWSSAHPYGFEEFAHSDVLQLLVECGLGGLFLIAIPVLIFRRGIADRAQGACFAAICFECLVSFPLHVPAAAFLFALLTGHLARAGYGLCVSERVGRVDGGQNVRWSAAQRPGMAQVGAGHGRRVWDRPAYQNGAWQDPAGRGHGITQAGNA